MCPYESSLLYPLGKFLVVLLLGCRVIQSLIFWETSTLFSRAAAPVCSATVQEGSHFSTSSPTSVVAWVVNFSHSDWCKVVSQCGFDLYFLGDEWCWASFHVSAGHLDVFFSKVSIHVFCPFLHWIICFLGCGVWWILYRFWILALCPICHLQISFPIPSVAF